MDLLKSIFTPTNPEPQFEGQCIIGTKDIPLIAARVHPADGRSYLAWRAAEVVCGFNLEGGLQQLIEHLKTYTGSKKIFVDPKIYKHAELMGAMQSLSKGYTFVSTDDETPCQGCIHVVVPQPNAPIVQLYTASPTVTALGAKLGVAPVSQSVPVTGTAQQVGRRLSQKVDMDTGMTMDELFPAPARRPSGHAGRIDMDTGLPMGGARKKKRTVRKRSAKKRTGKKRSSGRRH